ncbi:hypothetical protein CDL15_Pgr018887 [Punica granatum]|uniref:Uncharacterized protein n=1 Tax=Punica granatum TaxID=22663 RepID=A0A218WLU2_PUNGR|nr:hypothetical protein CDL15_Pgr018887 [Punica granatum]
MAASSVTPADHEELSSLEINHVPPWHARGRYLASVHEEKSRGSGHESRKTRFGVAGGVTREEDNRGSLGRMAWHASSGHGMVQGRARWTPKRRI